MHTFTGESIVIIYNSDLSGMVQISTSKKHIEQHASDPEGHILLKVPAKDLLLFVFQCFIVPRLIGILEGNVLDLFRLITDWRG